MHVKKQYAIPLMALLLVGCFMGGASAAYAIMSNNVAYNSVSVQSSTAGITLAQMEQSDIESMTALTMLPTTNAQSLTPYGYGLRWSSDGYFKNVGVSLVLTYKGPAHGSMEGINIFTKQSLGAAWVYVDLTNMVESGPVNGVYTRTYTVELFSNPWAVAEPGMSEAALMQIIYNVPGEWSYEFVAHADNT